MIYHNKYHIKDLLQYLTPHFGAASFLFLVYPSLPGSLMYLSHQYWPLLSHDDVIKWKIFRVTGPIRGELTGPGEFPAQRPVTRSFDVFFDLRLNKRLSKQPWGWWFETPSRSLWHQCNETILFYTRHSVFCVKKTHLIAMSSIKMSQLWCIFCVTLKIANGLCMIIWRATYFIVQCTLFR